MKKNFFLSFIFIFRLSVLPACVPGARESQKRVSNLLKLALHKVVSHHVCWKPNLGALQSSQSVRSTPGPSLWLASAKFEQE